MIYTVIIPSFAFVVLFWNGVTCHKSFSLLDEFAAGLWSSFVSPSASVVWFSTNILLYPVTEQPPLTSIIQKRRLTLFGHLVRMDELTDTRKILTAVPQSEWRRPVGRPYTSWMATLKNDLAQHNLTLEDAMELALNKPLWRLLAASGATHWWCMPNNDDDDDVNSTI